LPAPHWQAEPCYSFLATRLAGSTTQLDLAKGQLDDALDLLEPLQMSAARLRLEPQYDPLRNSPRFKAMLAQAEADPKRSPNAIKNLKVESTATAASVQH
jgi:hypothetical protein